MTGASDGELRAAPGSYRQLEKAARQQLQLQHVTRFHPQLLHVSLIHFLTGLMPTPCHGPS